MANARIRNPVGCRVPKKTSLTRPEAGHLILGPYTTPTTNTTVKTNTLVNVTHEGVLALHTTKVMPAGVVIMDPRYNWGSTTPGHFTLLPSTIEVFICARGGCLIGMDVSKVIDAAYLGAPVYESDEAGLCAIAASAAATVTGEAGHYMIGTLLDLRGGNTGTGTGAADGDLAEVDFRPFWGIVSSA